MSESRSDSKSTRMGRWGVVITLLLLLCVSQGTAWAQQTSPTQPGSASKLPLGNIEDWSSLSLEHSELVPERPLLGERDQNDPQFVRELWQLKWRQGDPIDLYVIRPKGIAKPPAILYLYSYPSESDVFRNDAYCERITSGGFAAIGFVSALTGHRYVNRPMKEWFVSELQEALATSVHDVQLILNYLATRGDLDMERIGMFGVGSGGSHHDLVGRSGSAIESHRRDRSLGRLAQLDGYIVHHSRSRAAQLREARISEEGRATRPCGMAASFENATRPPATSNGGLGHATQRARTP